MLRAVSSPKSQVRTILPDLPGRRRGSIDDKPTPGGRDYHELHQQQMKDDQTVVGNINLIII